LLQKGKWDSATDLAKQPKSGPGRDTATRDAASPTTAQLARLACAHAQLQKSPWPLHESNRHPSHYSPLTDIHVYPPGFNPIQTRMPLAALRTAAWRPPALGSLTGHLGPTLANLRSRPPSSAHTVMLGGEWRLGGVPEPCQPRRRPEQRLPQ
jgi:hypothetical protein